jgi:hypothetical protein
LLKPSNYPAIVPWLNEARDCEKREVVKLAELAMSGGSEAKVPVSWLPGPQEPVIANDRGRVRALSQSQITPDRVQADLLKNRHGSDVKDVALEKRRRFFRSWAPVPSIDSVGDFFHLKDNPVQANAVSQVLSENARRGLARWQVHGPEQSMGSAANAMRSLRSVYDAVQRIPRYKEHLREQVPGGQGCRELMHDYSMLAPRGSRTLLHAPYAMPDRRKVHSTSAPGLLKPLVESHEIERISRPGGFVVSLNDMEALAALKNRESNMASKIPFSGGSQDYSATSKQYGNFMVRI